MQLAGGSGKGALIQLFTQVEHRRAPSGAHRDVGARQDGNARHTHASAAPARDARPRDENTCMMYELENSQQLL